MTGTSTEIKVATHYAMKYARYFKRLARMDPAEAQAKLNKKVDMRNRTLRFYETVESGDDNVSAVSFSDTSSDGYSSDSASLPSSLDMEGDEGLADEVARMFNPSLGAVVDEVAGNPPALSNDSDDESQASSDDIVDEVVDESQNSSSEVADEVVDKSRASSGEVVNGIDEKSKPSSNEASDKSQVSSDTDLNDRSSSSSDEDTSS